MKSKQVEALLLQSLEHELGGAKVYETALACVTTSELKEELWQHLEHVRARVTILEEICRFLDLNPKRETPGRKAVRSVAESLVVVMKMAQSAGDPVAAELVARESVMLAEAKDQLDWDLLGRCAWRLSRARGDSPANEVTEDRDHDGMRLYAV